MATTLSPERTDQDRTIIRRASFADWLRRQSITFILAGVILAILFLVALTGPYWAPYSFNEMLVGTPYAGPSAQHWLGTDNFGRDVFSRVVYGARIDLGLAMAATGLSVALGTLLGLLVGYLGGWVDEIVMRLVEILISVPPLILALLVLGSLEPSFIVVVLVVALLFAPRVATVVRAATLDVVMEDFVTIARLRGESALSVAVRELLPNVATVVLIEFSLRTGYAVIFIGGLGFLGFGAAPPTPEWGLMINEGRDFLSAAPWSVVGPSLAVAALVIALSLFTEGLSELFGLSVKKG